MIRKTPVKPKRKSSNETVKEAEVVKTPTDILSTLKIDIKHKNENQKKLTQAIKNCDVTICTGPAGSGKTYLSCLQALSDLKNNDKIKKIVLVKSVTVLDTESIGYLKGDLDSKMEPFMYSFTGNFEKIIGKVAFENLKLQGFIEILPISYMRGVNIDSAVVVVDEVQNITIENMRTILTRLGQDSKMVLLGDAKQIDTKNKNNNSLAFLTKHFKNVDKIGVVEFTKDDIIRHPLIKVIEDIFDEVLTVTPLPIKQPYKKFVIEDKKESIYQKIITKIKLLFK